MNSLSSEKPSKKVLVTGCLAFVVLGTLTYCMWFFPDFAFNIFMPILLFYYAVVCYRRGREKIVKSGGRDKWYSQHYMLFALGYGGLALVTPLNRFIPNESFPFLKSLLLIAIGGPAFFFYIRGLILYWRQRKQQ